VHAREPSRDGPLYELDMGDMRAASRVRRTIRHTQRDIHAIERMLQALKRKIPGDLGGQLRQLRPRVPLNKQRHEVPHRSPIELGVLAVRVVAPGGRDPHPPPVPHGYRSLSTPTPSRCAVSKGQVSYGLRHVGRNLARSV